MTGISAYGGQLNGQSRRVAHRDLGVHKIPELERDQYQAYRHHLRRYSRHGHHPASYGAGDRHGRAAAGGDSVGHAEGGGSSVMASYSIYSMLPAETAEVE